MGVDLQDFDLEDDTSTPRAMLQVREKAEKRSFSAVKSLMLLGTALLMVSRAVWIQNHWKQVEEDGQAQFLEIVPAGYGHEVDLSITCTYETGAATWTKDCTCSGIFHCGCVMEITQCMKGGGCANICWQKEEEHREDLLL